MQPASLRSGARRRLGWWQSFLLLLAEPAAAMVNPCRADEISPAEGADGQPSRIIAVRSVSEDGFRHAPPGAPTPSTLPSDAPQRLRLTAAAPADATSAVPRESTLTVIPRRRTAGWPTPGETTLPQADVTGTVDARRSAGGAVVFPAAQSPPTGAAPAGDEPRRLADGIQRDARPLRKVALPAEVPSAARMPAVPPSGLPVVALSTAANRGEAVALDLPRLLAGSAVGDALLHALGTPGVAPALGAAAALDTAPVRAGRPSWAPPQDVPTLIRRATEYINLAEAHALREATRQAIADLEPLEGASNAAGDGSLPYARRLRESLRVQLEHDQALADRAVRRLAVVLRLPAGCRLVPDGAALRPFALVPPSTPPQVLLAAAVLARPDLDHYHPASAGLLQRHAGSTRAAWMAAVELPRMPLYEAADTVRLGFPTPQKQTQRDALQAAIRAAREELLSHHHDLRLLQVQAHRAQQRWQQIGEESPLSDTQRLACLHRRHEAQQQLAHSIAAYNRAQIRLWALLLGESTAAEPALPATP